MTRKKTPIEKWHKVPGPKTFRKWFNRVLAKHKRKQLERAKKAGPHKCIKMVSGTIKRVTGRGGVILKRPVVVNRLYECKICGRWL